MSALAPRTAIGRTLVHIALAGVVAFLFLFQPLPAVNRNWCAETTHVGHGLKYLLDIDSPAYLDIADEPEHLFVPFGEWRTRQMRPLYPLVASVLAPLVRDVPGLRAMSTHPAYPAFALINLATLVAVLGVFTALVGRSPRAWTLGTVVGLLLFSNDVAKVYTWTPHQQLFNLLEPLACAWLVREVACRPALTTARTAGYALGAGILLLAYGSFLLLLAALLAGLLARVRGGEPLGRVAAAALGVGAFPVPMLAWTLFVRHHAGQVYLGEILECRDFVWMADAWRRGGPMQVARAFRVYSANFFATFGRELVIPAFVALTAVVLRVAAWERTRAVLRDRRATILACLFASAMNLVLYWLMGNARACYGARLTFAVFPPLLAAAAVVLSSVLEDARPATWRAALIALVVFVAIAHTYVVAKVGPWC